MAADNRNWDTAGLAALYGANLRAYFSRRVPGEDADDLVQEVFLKLQTSKADGPVRNVESYLFRTAHSVFIDYARSNARTKRLSFDLLGDRSLTSNELSPERIAIAQQEYISVMKVIEALPPRTRQAFELHRFEHLTYQAIGERMGITKESVKDLMQRALLRIAVELQGVQ